MQYRESIICSLPRHGGPDRQQSMIDSANPESDFLLWPSRCFSLPKSRLPPIPRNMIIPGLLFFCGAEIALRFPCTGPDGRLCVPLCRTFSNFCSYRSPLFLICTSILGMRCRIDPLCPTTSQQAELSRLLSFARHLSSTSRSL